MKTTDPNSNKNPEVISKRSLSFSNDDSVEITISPNGGACFGVVRAIKLGQQAATKGKDSNNPVFSFGAIVHNPKTIRELEAQGVKTVEDQTEVTGGTVILRSHGVKQEIEKDFKTRGVQVVDATCPLVKKPQKIAASLGNKGYYLVLVGDSNHPEVKGVVSYFAKDNYLVTYKIEDLEKIPADVSKVGIVAQTTIEVKVLDKIVEACRKRFSEVAVYNTICDATSIRQEEAEILAKGADVLVVVGGKNSSNTNKLVKICKQYQPDTYLIEEMNELNLQWFLGKRKIGVTGGASTPQDYVDDVGQKIADLLNGSQGTPTLNS